MPVSVTRVAPGSTSAASAKSFIAERTVRSERGRLARDELVRISCKLTNSNFTINPLRETACAEANAIREKTRAGPGST